MFCQLGSEEALQEILKKDNVVLQFSAAWCGPCKAIAPTIKEIAEKNADVEIVYIDIDSHGALAEKYQVRAVPTFIFFKNGKKQAQMSGASQETFKTHLEELKNSKSC